MKFVIRIKHFDVSIINRTESMTSVGGITQLDNESEVYRKRGDPQRKRKQDRRKTAIPENSYLEQFFKLISLSCNHWNL